ncbi:hypothetical protein [Dyella acidiphila]|uniref:PH domain-containing protein n=1 Tax=Dyella acidiphila TaxID=2775866 RepID=A0ABR9G6N2_9GAMM|nr:hypothetical protein [Dyella acidiphila]MBE1159709.1 hypothetical protein [Dyella acidiphila]
MVNLDRMEIQFSKLKCLVTLVMCAAFGAIFFLLSGALCVEHFHAGSPNLMFELFGAAVLTWSVSLCLVSMFSATPGLVLDSQGIVSCAGRFSPIFVPWSEVVSIKLVRRGKSGQVICVRLSEPAGKALEHMRPLQKMRYWLRWIAPYGVYVHDVYLDISRDNLLDLLQHYQATYVAQP